MLSEPKVLITPSRLDVFSKTPLVHAWAQDLDDTWGRELYSAYMLSTRPPRGFSEDNTKFSLRQYIEYFHELFESIRVNGFDPQISSIPTTTQGITNGAHRLAIALVLDLKVSQEFTTEPSHIYNYKYMQSMGLSGKYIDAIALEFLKYADRTTAFCALGISPNLAESIEKTLEIAGFEQIYKKAIKLTKIGQRRLMKLLYGTNEWWSNELYESLAIERFYDDSSSFFFFVASKDSEAVTSAKSQIREKYFDQFTFKKFHSTDNRIETIRVADSILNDNSLLIMNQAPLESERNIISKIECNPILQRLDPQYFAVDGSAILEILGIRKARDLDFIQIEKRYSELPIKASNHNSEYQSLPINPTQLILDPRNYAVIEGFKFVSIPQIIAFKAHRGERKDLLDISQLCARQVNGSHYADENTRHKIAYLRFRLVLRRRVNMFISPLPIWLQILIRKSYVFVRDLFKV